MNAPQSVQALTTTDSTGRPSPDDASATLDLQVQSIRLLAPGIHAFELALPDGEGLPAFSAGAHIDVHLPDGLTRTYSLSGDPADRKRWTLGVLREQHSRGGSRAMHELVRVGESLKVGMPRNAFELKPGSGHVVLLAGGIGITPLKSMAHSLIAGGRSFELHYCARTPGHVAFAEELTALIPAGSLHLHFDGGDPAQGLDIAGLLAEPAPGTELYYCGPAGFMKACAEAAAGWPAGTVHFEHFAPPVAKTDVAVDDAFEVRLARAGVTVRVGPDETIVRAIELAGYRVPTSCMSGLCGTCKVKYLEGEVDHQDFILSDEEKSQYLTVCCSRARSASLVLDV